MPALAPTAKGRGEDEVNTVFQVGQVAVMDLHRQAKFVEGQFQPLLEDGRCGGGESRQSTPVPARRWSRRGYSNRKRVNGEFPGA